MNFLNRYIVGYKVPSFIYLQLQKNKFVTYTLLLLFLHIILYANINNETNQLDKFQSNTKHSNLSTYQEKLRQLDMTLNNTESIWLKRYENFHNYHAISEEIKLLENNDLDSAYDTQTAHRLETLHKQQIMLEQYRNKPFGELLEKPTLETPPTLTNPFGIFTALSYMRHIASLKTNMQNYRQNLEKLLATIEKKIEILESILTNTNLTNKQKQEYQSILNTTREQNFEFQSAKNILETTIDVFDKDTNEIETNLELQIKNQILKLGYIGVGIIISIVIAFIFKMLVKRYIHHHERAYTTSKVINVFNITVIFFILLFAYIDNATYAVAMVGFASAGLAIAMKDMFMSTLGWLVIVLGGSIHVGDRIRVRKENEVFIGDVLDISMLRITIYDDITQASYRENHRAGRLIFIPNNYIFTNLIANYTYGDLTNIWDSVEVCITFDSNIEKAKKIALEVAMIHANTYTQETKRQMRSMRDRFSLVDSALNVNPRAFNFIKENGMEISVWFQNYAYATLKLKSIIAKEIVEKYLQEDDIQIAYPITRIVYDKQNGLGLENFAFTTNQ
ncbi:hypothetical protein CQA53_02445 [Helicobacter didelphidarum]|uniref:Mechanosensitive ion channel MscS domain-containing protein n=1 Tax=Helicobacter didelphidarum TaxID=2040648 RepID=A0A3D8IQ70_9HELI|nr:mechanosensitive ion channel domain-containing protein [Helicobacter didelphidarum]RDU67130.1 hypothetical protein CQA53_02445 [Helicobacter didelphidarum]